jgi:hypothetical protein
MNLHVEPMKEPMMWAENRTIIKLNGYAFVDEFGSCHIIVYGEGLRDAYLKYLKEINEN